MILVKEKKKYNQSSQAYFGFFIKFRIHYSYFIYFLCYYLIFLNFEFYFRIYIFYFFCLWGLFMIISFSIYNSLSYRLLSKNFKVKIYKIIILPVVLYGCETWSLTLREESRLRVLLFVIIVYFQINGTDISLERMLVVGRTPHDRSWKKKPQQSWHNQMTSWKTETWNKIWQKIDIFCFCERIGNS